MSNATYYPTLEGFKKQNKYKEIPDKKEKKMYYLEVIQSRDNEFLGIRLFEVDNEGKMKYLSTGNGIVQNDNNEYVLDFKDINDKKIQFYDFDNSKNVFKDRV